MSSPLLRTRRSPNLLTMPPASGDVTKRTSAKTEMTMPAWKALTPNVLAKIGREGIRMPNPSATKNAMVAKTATSRGRSARSGVLRRALPSVRILSRASLVDGPKFRLGAGGCIEDTMRGDYFVDGCGGEAIAELSCALG